MFCGDKQISTFKPKCGQRMSECSTLSKACKNLNNFSIQQSSSKNKNGSLLISAGPSSNVIESSTEICCCDDQIHFVGSTGINVDVSEGSAVVTISAEDFPFFYWDFSYDLLGPAVDGIIDERILNTKTIFREEVMNKFTKIINVSNNEMFLKYEGNKSFIGLFELSFNIDRDTNSNINNDNFSIILEKLGLTLRDFKYFTISEGSTDLIQMSAVSKVIPNDVFSIVFKTASVMTQWKFNNATFSCKHIVDV